MSPEINIYMYVSLATLFVLESITDDELNEVWSFMLLAFENLDKSHEAPYFIQFIIGYDF